MANKIKIYDLLKAKQAGKKFSAVACYDYTTAKLAAESGIEMLLVGDSAAQVMLGFDSTLPVTMDFMVAITAAVRRAAPEVCLVADMPFLSYQVGIGEAVKNAGRFVTEAGADVVKIEVSNAYLDVVKAVSDAGMAVMAHVGIRPQSVGKMGQLMAEGTTAEMGLELIGLCKRMVAAGASMLLIEGTAAEVAGIVTNSFEIPVVGCGSGSGCDGNILIAPDILGLTCGKMPKFSKKYADLAGEFTKSFALYADDIRSGKFPDDEHCYHMKPGELDRLKAIISERK